MHNVSLDSLWLGKKPSFIPNVTCVGHLVTMDQGMIIARGNV